MGGTLSQKARTFYHCAGEESSDLSQYDLNNREKELVRTTWARLVDQKDTLSIDIFLRIFELIPEAKKFFPFKNAVGDALIKHPYFKGHAMRFINAVRMTVGNLDAWEVILIPSLLKLGQQHANIPGFRHEYFITFSVAMNDVFSKYLGRAYTAETRTAWTKIFSLITSKVEAGYFEGQAINLRRTSQLIIKPENSSHSDDATDKQCPLDGATLPIAPLVGSVIVPAASCPDEHASSRDDRRCPLAAKSSHNGFKSAVPSQDCTSSTLVSSSSEEQCSASSHIRNNGALGTSAGTEPPRGSVRDADNLGNCL